MFGYTLGMFPLILTVLNREYSAAYENPNYGLFVKGGTSQGVPYKNPKTYLFWYKAPFRIYLFVVGH